MMKEVSDCYFFCVLRKLWENFRKSVIVIQSSFLYKNHYASRRKMFSDRTYIENCFCCYSFTCVYISQSVSFPMNYLVVMYHDDCCTRTFFCEIRRKQSFQFFHGEDNENYGSKVLIKRQLLQIES